MDKLYSQNTRRRHGGTRVTGTGCWHSGILGVSERVRPFAAPAPFPDSETGNDRPLMAMHLAGDCFPGREVAKRQSDGSREKSLNAHKIWGFEGFMW